MSYGPFFFFLSQIELDTAQQQIFLLTQQKELLRERMESMSDYPHLTKEKAELQGQLQLLRKQLEEAQEENRLLHAGRRVAVALRCLPGERPCSVKDTNNRIRFNLVKIMHI